MCPLARKGIDVAELHDCFTSNEVIADEGLGLCGEGGADIVVGNFEGMNRDARFDDIDRFFQGPNGFFRTSLLRSPPKFRGVQSAPFFLSRCEATAG